MADIPTHRLISKKAGETKWTELAAAWENAKGQVSLTFSKPVEAGTRALLVKNEPPKKAAHG